MSALASGPTRVVWDMTGGRGRCAFGVVYDYGPDIQPAVHRYVVHRCDVVTDGLTVDVPVAEATVFNIEVCPDHAQVLYELFGRPRGEERWVRADTAPAALGQSSRRDGNGGS